MGKLSELTQEGLKDFLSYDAVTGNFYFTKTRGGKTEGERAGRIRKDGYINIRIAPKCYLAHRLAWLYVYGEWPTNVIDHINGIKSDNRICNLREVTQTQNKQNTKKATVKNRVGMQGVSRCGNRFWSRIKSDGKFNYLGMYDTPEEAHQAYLTAKRELHTTCTI